MLRLLTGMLALASGLVRAALTAARGFARSWWPGALKGRLRLAEVEFDGLRRDARRLGDRVRRLEGERLEAEPRRRRQAQWRTPAGYDPPAPRGIDFEYWARRDGSAPVA